MKATGIVRRIDDLGRVVIPKEVRRSMRINEGDPLELYTDGDVICFKKYDTRPELQQTLETLENQMLDQDITSSIDSDDAAAIRVIIKMLKKNITGKNA